MRAYNESYLNDAKNNLADFFDYAVHDCKLNPDSFIQLFIQSGYADKFERGNPSVISGMSGTELSKLSGVKLRSIQMYEQRVNSIDKAQAGTVYKLSRVLGCTVEDLLESPEM